MSSSTKAPSVEQIEFVKNLYRSFDRSAAFGRVYSKLITKNGSQRNCELLSDTHYLLNALHDDERTQKLLENIKAQVEDHILFEDNL